MRPIQASVVLGLTTCATAFWLLVQPAQAQWTSPPAPSATGTAPASGYGRPGYGAQQGYGGYGARPGYGAQQGYGGYGAQPGYGAQYPTQARYPYGYPAQTPQPGAKPPPPQPAPEPPPKVLGMIEGETADTGGRTLNGHTFAYPHLLSNPFILTNVYMGAGIEFFSQEGLEREYESSPGETEIFTFDRDLALVRLRLGVDFAPWDVFSFGVQSEYLAQIGVNDESLFLYGAESGYDVSPSIKFQLWRSEPKGHHLSLQPYGRFSGGLRAVPQGLLRELARELADIAADQKKTACLVVADFGCAFEEVDLVTAMQYGRQSFGGGGNLAFAQTVGRAFGFHLSMGLEGSATSYTWGESGTIDEGAVAFHAGLSPSFNFAPGFPLGITFEYRLQVQHSSFEVSPPEPTEEPPPDAEPVETRDLSDTITSHRLAGGLYFTGRRDLMLGALVGVSLFKESPDFLQEPSAEPSATVVAIKLDMRYFF